MGRYTHSHSRFMLLYNRKQCNIVKQLDSNENKRREKREKKCGNVSREKGSEVKGGKGERCSVILASLPCLHLIAGGGEKAGKLERGKRA